MNEMDPVAFLADLDQKPTRLRELATLIDHGGLRWPIGEASPQRILLAGMGSSWFAAQQAALRLRRAGCTAVAELASAAQSWPTGSTTLVVGISASGGSAETLDFIGRYDNAVALTNTADSAVQALATHTVQMHAGPERSGVACRSYQHTLIALLALEQQLTGTDLALADIVRRAADATHDLLDRRAEWLPRVSGALEGGDGVWVLAPAERIGSALQGALMLREGPRRMADGCETGDWSHVDVYLTKTLRYRALVFPGSRYDGAAAEWMRQRSSVAVSVGGEFGGAAETVRFPGDDHPLVAALTEVIVPELLAQSWWSAPLSPTP